MDSKVTGSEDCTARIWDLRTDRAQKCFAGCFNNNAVDSVLFSTKSAGHAPAELLAASGSNVILFDLRKEGIVDRVPRAIVCVKANPGIEDEDGCDINAISIHPKGHTLAAGMDDGSIRVIDLQRVRERSPANAPQPQLLSDCVNTLGWNSRGRTHAHSNIVSTVCYRPAPLSSTELISGSFDCCIQLWEQGVGRRKGSYAFTSDSQMESVNGGVGKAAADMGPLLNPPFVHACSYACNGRAILCGNGDGALNILHANTLQHVHKVEAHTGFVSSVHVPNSGGLDNSSTPPEATAIGHIAFTGGNDCIIQAWHIVEASKAKGKKNTEGKNAHAEGPDMSLHCLWSLQHGHKINALTTLYGASVRPANSAPESVFGDSEQSTQTQCGVAGSESSNKVSSRATVDLDFSLVVADVTCDLSVYSYQG